MTELELSRLGTSATIYQWYTSPDYLIRSLLPSPSLIEAAVDHDAESVLRCVPPGAALFVFHLNCTHTEHFPRERSALLDGLRRRGVTVINGGLTDISKRSLQRHCASLEMPTTVAQPGGDPSETIIVKTDLNYGGASEWGLSAREMETLGLTDRTELIYEPDHYRVLPRSRANAEWWDDPSLICERFISNRLDRWYRIFLFLEHVVICELVSKDRIKKVGSSRVAGVWPLVIEGGGVQGKLDRFGLAHLARDVGRLAKAMQMDFGAIDVMEDDEERHYIVDVNATPAFNTPITGVAEHLRRAVSRVTEVLERRPLGSHLVRGEP